MNPISFLCLCPTYGRPASIIENSIQLFLNQTHENATLLIYDDLGTLRNTKLHLPKTDKQVSIASGIGRQPDIITKYNEMLKSVDLAKFDAIALWDDDDVYLPTHLAQHAEVLQSYQLSYPSLVLSTYTGHVQSEVSGGRFWASLAVQVKAFSDVGGFVQTKRADFDQISLGKFRSTMTVGDPAHTIETATSLSRAVPTYVFRWADTMVPHSQGYMKSPDDETWYDRIVPASLASISRLVPRLHDDTVKNALEFLRA